MNYADIPEWLVPVFVVVALIDLVLKGFALWRAAQRKQLGWFIALLILNTAGILPLLYLFATNKSKD